MRCRTVGLEQAVLRPPDALLAGSVFLRIAQPVDAFALVRMRPQKWFPLCPDLI